MNIRQIDFKARDKDIYGIIIKGSVKQNIIILNLFASNKIVRKYMKQNWQN